MGDRITSLPKDVRSLLRTGVAITHIAQCVEELVVNALDAGATCVAVRVDLPCFKIQVVDNGKGIQCTDLDIIGERYATSKCYQVSDLDNLCYYGYRGEALASLRDISNILEINSRSKHSTQTYCKIFQQGKSLTVNESVIPRSSAGTTVTVYDLFYNLPVRKKCCNAGLDLEKIRQKIEGIALMKPSVSFSLRNDVNGNVILQTHKTNSTLNTFTYLYGPARSKGLTEVEGQEGIFTVSGYIGKKGCNKKDYQFIYINGRLVLKTKLHKVVNNQLSKSLILRKKLELTSNKFRGHIMTTSPTKTTDQHGMFLLNITCPYKEYDITFEPAKTLVEFKDFDVLQHCLEKTVTDFLKRESLHLGILAENFAKKASDESPSKRSDGLSDDYGENSRNQVTEKLDFVGLKNKPEIKTTDRNGLFSKIVKRSVTPQNLVKTSINEQNESFTCSKSPIQTNASDTSDENSEQIRISETNSGESESEMKTPQNKTGAVNLTPKLHISSSSDTDMIETQLSCNRNNSSLLEKSDKKICDEDYSVNKRSKIRLPVEGSSSEGELSEDPLPTKQRTGPSPPKKQLICIDTPLVKETGINVSILSKLRKGSSKEDCSPISTDTDKHTKYTKLKVRDETEQQRQTTKPLCSEKFKGTNNKFGELEDDNCHNSHRKERLITSSLQGLRKFRTKEQDTSSESLKTEKYPPLKHSMQELRKHKIQNLGNKSSVDNSTNRLHNYKVSGISEGKHKLQKVVRFQDTGKSHPDSEVSKNDIIYDKEENDHRSFVDIEKVEQKSKTNNSAILCDSRSIEPSHSSLTSAPDQHVKSLVENSSNDKLSDDSMSPCLSSPIDIDEACQSLENCVTEIENIISKTVSESSADTLQVTSRKSKLPLETSRTQSALEANMENDIDKKSVKQFMSSDQMIQTAHEYLQKCKGMTDTSESTEQSIDNDKCIDQAVQSIENHTTATDTYYVTQPIKVNKGVLSSHNPSSISISLNSFCMEDSQREATPLDLSCNPVCDESFDKLNRKLRNVETIDMESTHIYQNKEYREPISAESTQDYLPINERRNPWNDREKNLTHQDISVLSYFDTNISNNSQENLHISENQPEGETNLAFDIYMKYRKKRRTHDYDNDEVDEFLICHETMREIDESQAFFESTQKFSVSEDSGIITECTDMDVSEDEEKEIPVQFGNNVPVFRSKTSVSPCLSEGFSPVDDIDIDPESAATPAISSRQEYCKNNSDPCSMSLSNAHTLSEKRQDSSVSQGHDMTACCYNDVSFPCSKNINIDTSGITFLSRKAENTHKGEGDCKQHINNYVNNGSYNTFNNSDDLFSNNSTINTQQNCDSMVVNSENQISVSDRSSKASIENPLSKNNYSDIANKDSLHESNDKDRGTKSDMSDLKKKSKPSKVCDSYNLHEFSPEGDLQLGEIGRQTESAKNPSTSTIGNQNVSEIFSPEGDNKLIELYQHGQEVTKTTGDTSASMTTAGQNNDDNLFSPGGDSDLRDVQYESKTWVEMTDPKSGKKLYVNTRSGHSISSDEWTPPDDKQTEECPCSTPATKQSSITELSPGSSKSLKDMMDYHLSKEEDELLSVKWKDNSQIKNDERRVEDLLKEWENPVFSMAAKDMPSLQVNHMSKASSKAYQALNPCVFYKEMLNSFKVLGQVDNKFIACSLQTTECNNGGEMLVLIDQHAAHERVRLESLTRKAYEIKDDINVLCHTDLAKEVELVLTEEVVRIMASFHEEFKTIGIQFTVNKTKRDTVILHTLPSCMVQTENTDIKRKKTEFPLRAAQNLIKEYVEVLQNTRGSKGRLPNTIHKILCSEACHGAIKFGDPLTLQECEELLKLLSKCKLPFQCAHGRPSVVPLMQLKDRNKGRKRPNLWKIGRHLQQ